ncbi:MAG: hypothetical protein NC034_06140 [Ruminococcus sp.]|nr:hypothetical protein [Ruminococcus sp.]
MYAKISIDTGEYDRGLDGASKKTSSFGEKLKNGLGTAAKAGAAAIGAASTAIGALAKMSVEGYADYEQLAGGVETLFKSSSDTVLAYANNAYKTAGMSANEYMETVTSFSASLLQGLGGDTEKAADIADQAIVDMSDNANKMGTDMEAIQNAYQGFAKQNYTMLDNLKLGYGGTAAEMARLINDSGVLGDSIEVTAKTVNDVSFDKIIEAIHVVQDNMGITGTTAAEASETISGSIGSMKSAWENLVVGFVGGNAQLDVLISNLVESVKTAAGNLIPAVTQALEGIGSMVQQLAPILSEQLPILIENVVPSLLDSAEILLTALVDALIAAAPVLSEAAMSIINTLMNFLIENYPTLIEAALQIVTELANGISENLPELIPAIVEMVLKIVETLTDPDNLSNMIDAALALIMALADGLLEALPTLIEKAPEIVGNLVDAVIENAPKLLKSAAELIGKLASGIIDNLPLIGEKAGEIVEKVVSGIKDLLYKITDVGKNIVQGLWEGIQSMGSWINDKVTGFFSGITDSVKGLLGIHSPSRVFAGIGSNMALGIGEGWNSEFDAIRRGIENGMDFSGSDMKFPSAELAVSSYSDGSGGNAEWIDRVAERAAAIIGNASGTTVNYIMEKVIINSDDDIDSLNYKLEESRRRIAASMGG